MANRKVDPEEKRIPFMVTIQKKISDKIKEKATEKKMSYSAFVENLFVKELEK